MYLFQKRGEKMNMLLSYLSFIPYFIYLYLLIKDELLNEKNKVFRFDTLILVAIFIYFAHYHVTYVSKILFFTINLYLLVNKLYDKNIKGKIEFKKDYLKILFVYLIAIILCLPYILKAKLTLSYELSFALILLIHFVFLFIKKICQSNKI